ncbi:MAG TPA: sigma-70 family RNA polymerase sigma factor [Armatimonadota bacterium]|nr:sigma-70 family RNA polymerase sigma factor [Armatimonadota bacterium]
MITDDALVSDCLRGNEDAFRLLVERYRPRLNGLAAGILHDGDQASDAVQDAFLKAYNALAEYRGSGVFWPWIRRILVNHCLSLLRQRHSYLSLEELDRDLASHERSPEEQALAENEADAIRRAMGRLPAHYRAALVLRVLEGLSYREIAQLLSVPESTVETWIHRGRLRMRTLLQPAPGAARPKRLAQAPAYLQKSYRHDVC